MEDAAAMMERRIFIAFLAGLGAVACAAAWAAGVPAGVIAAATVAFAVSTFYHWNHAIGSQKPPPGVPVVPGLPLLGNAVVLVRDLARMHDWVLEQHRTVGAGRKTFCFSGPFMRTFVSVSNPACLEYILKTRLNSGYVKGQPFRDNFGPLLGRGIFVADGDAWRRQRKLAARIFSVAAFREHVGTVFHAKADLLLARLAAAARDGCAVDIHDVFYRFTLDTFSRIGFGTDPGCLTATGKIEFAIAFDRAQRTTNSRFWLPCWRLLELLDGRGRQLRRDIKTVRAFAAGIIAERRAALAAAEAAAHADADAAAAAVAAANLNNDDDDDTTDDDVPARGPASDQQQPQQQPPSPSASSASGASSRAADAAATVISGADADNAKPCCADAVAATAEKALPAGANAAARPPPSNDLLALFMADAASGGDGHGHGGDEELTDHVLNFIIAGRDTTAQALSWTLYELLRAPGVVGRLLAEAEAVLGPAAGAAAGGGGAGRKPSYDEITQLRYARAVFLEGLRLHPSVPENAKVALTTDVLPDGTRVPAGALILYSAYAINRAPEVWGADADSFRPERWLERAAAPSPYVNPSFHAGLRLCLGQRLAELEGVYVLVTLLRRFKLAFAPGRPREVTYDLSASLPMKGGLWVSVEERECCA